MSVIFQMNNVAYETEAAEGSTGRCPIQLQRETPTGLVDTICGSEVQQKQAGLCRCVVFYITTVLMTSRPLFFRNYAVLQL